MPASSRKRNKGKERKAKKEETEKVMIRNLWCTWTNRCDHGCTVDIPDDHPVSNFMDLLFTKIRYNMNYMFTNTREALQEHQTIWNDNSHRQMALNTMVIIGTNILLRGDERIISWPCCIAKSILVLEHDNGTDGIASIINSRAVTTKSRDLDPDCSSIKRDLLKFYRKRTTCKCLKKMHLEARKYLLKTSLCYGCLKKCERKALSVCSRCMVTQFCSRKCQVAAWPEHKSDCDIFVKANRNREGDE